MNKLITQISQRISTRPDSSLRTPESWTQTWTASRRWSSKVAQRFLKTIKPSRWPNFARCCVTASSWPWHPFKSRSWWVSQSLTETQLSISMPSPRFAPRKSHPCSKLRLWEGKPSLWMWANSEHQILRCLTMMMRLFSLSLEELTLIETLSWSGMSISSVLTTFQKICNCREKKVWLSTCWLTLMATAELITKNSWSTSRTSST